MIQARWLGALAVGFAIVSAPALSRADTTCTDSTTCEGGDYCSESGVCTARQANGQPACTPSSGATNCQSGFCSASGVCVPTSGGCYLDSDCSNVQFCNRTTYACTALLADGSPLPADGLHNLCVAGDPNDACSSGRCDPQTSTCGSTSAAVEHDTSGASAGDAGDAADGSAAAAAVISEYADAGIDGAVDVQAIEKAIEQHIDKEIPGLSCSAAPSPMGGSSNGNHGGIVDFLVLVGGLALFRRVTSKASSSARTDRRRSPAA